MEREGNKIIRIIRIIRIKIKIKVIVKVKDKVIIVRR
jgi:hypothetical protein